MAEISIEQALALAMEHHQAGRLGDAERLYRAILAAAPQHADALHLLGVVAHQVGRNDVACDLIGQAISINGSVADYHSNLANVLKVLGRAEEAVTASRAAIGLRPDFAEAHSNLANALTDLGQSREAVDACHTAIALRPDWAVAHCNLGVALAQLDRMNEAAAAYQTAIRLQPDYAQAYSNLGGVLCALGQLEAAVVAAQTAINLQPGLHDAHSNLGAALTKLGRFEQAAAALNQAITLQPDYAEAHCNLGRVLTELGQLQEAICACRTAIRLEPAYAQAHLNLSIAHLLLGDLPSAWPHYEWRMRVADTAGKSRFDQPQWRGEEIGGGAILLHAEQGFGDTLQFCRYAAMVRALGARVILQAPRPLVRLIRSLDGIDQLVAEGEPLPDFDVHCPLMSLPLAFGTNLQTIPASAAYLRAEPEAVEHWRQRLGPSGFKVGIVWQGKPTSTAELGRSAPLAAFAPLAETPGLRLISLQKVHGLDQLSALPAGMRVETLGADFDEGPDAFIDTAALMMNLDLVITVDTAVGHLAGALGRPTWLALQAVPHWVWMMQRQDSPWYPNHRLFRQSQRGDWRGVFERMRDQLVLT